MSGGEGARDTSDLGAATAGLPRDVDVLIIGSGGAGTTAALESGAADLTTLVIESTEHLGGAAALSGGGCCIPGSPLQQHLGISDSPQAALDDWARWGGPDADLEWASAYLDAAVNDLYEWAAALGVAWERVEWFEGNRVPRWHQPRGGGARMMEIMRHQTAALPVSWRTLVRATALLPGEDGTVRGALVQVGTHEVEVSARVVVVATGGFTGNPDLLDAYASTPDLLCGGAPGARGEGHDMLASVGARFAPLERIWTYPYATPDIRYPESRRGLAVRGVPNDIWLDAQGHRFHNEHLRGGATGTPAILRLTPPSCWSIFDAHDAASLTLSDPYFGREGTPDRERIEAFLERSPHVHMRGSIEELAAACGLPVENAVNSVEAFNAGVRAGALTDDRARLLNGLHEVAKPPFYGVEFFPMARKNLSGVITDRSCRVQLADGGTVGNLLAAGEVAGMAGGRINGVAALEGTLLGPSLYSGRVAGRAAVEICSRASRRDEPV